MAYHGRMTGKYKLPLVLQMEMDFAGGKGRKRGWNEKSTNDRHGGTIASRRTETGLAPQLLSEDILEYVPQAAAICCVEAIQLFNMDSTNMEPKHWVKIGRDRGRTV